MAAYYLPKSGLGHVASYQVSGIPYALATAAANSASAPTQVSFPSVTKTLTIKNVGGGPALRVGFSANGLAGSNYFLLQSSESISMDIKVTNIYLRSTTGAACSASVIASLTGISIEDLPNNWSGSQGVG